MPELHNWTGTRIHILYVVAGSPDSSGADLRRELDDAYGEEWYNSRFYQNIDALVDEGYVEKEIVDRRTNAYRITEKGESALEAYHEWLSSKMNALDQSSASSASS